MHGAVTTGATILGAHLIHSYFGLLLKRSHNFFTSSRCIMGLNFSRVNYGHYPTSPIHSLKLPSFLGGQLADLPNSQTVRMAICVLTVCAHSLSRPEIYDFCSLLIGNVRIVALLCLYMLASLRHTPFSQSTMSRMDSINKRILPLRCNKCQYTVEIFTRLALWRLVWLLAK